jgi:hypothetical protein
MTLLTEPNVADAGLSQLEPAVDPIEVRRAPGPEAYLLGAARRWARALETTQRHKPTDGETAELALYDELADADALRTAELALYRAVLASGLAPE